MVYNNLMLYDITSATKFETSFSLGSNDTGMQ